MIESETHSMLVSEDGLINITAVSKALEMAYEEVPKII